MKASLETREGQVSCANGDSRYDDLVDATVRTLSTLNVKDYQAHSNRQFRYIGERTAAVRRQFGERMHRSTDLEDVAVIVALRRLINHSEPILRGVLSGGDCISAKPGLWRRMMCDWPMGEYGRKLAEYINAHGLARGKMLELGAGVGHASKFIQADEQTLYVKTDVNALILQMYNSGGILEVFDIDSDDAPYENFDIVFASNVLHCAASKRKTLKSIFRMLGAGGCLVFSEGTPEVRPGHDWCLAPLFGFFDGWWDRGGFIDFEHWSDLARDAGFSIIAREPLLCGPNLLGNLIACRKQASRPG